jgi:hypothetical protein
MQQNTQTPTVALSATKYAPTPNPHLFPFMEHDRSLTYSYDPVTGRYSEPVQSTQHTIYVI